MYSLKCDTASLLAGGALYRALGVYSPPRGDRSYVYAVPGEIRAYRVNELGGVQFLLDVWPDPDHWRALYPKGRDKIDGLRARAAIMRECVEAGPYVPPPELLAGGAPIQSTAKEKGGRLSPPSK